MRRVFSFIVAYVIFINTLEMLLIKRRTIAVLGENRALPMDEQKEENPKPSESETTINAVANSSQDSATKGDLDKLSIHNPVDRRILIIGYEIKSNRKQEILDYVAGTQTILNQIELELAEIGDKKQELCALTLGESLCYAIDEKLLAIRSLKDLHALASYDNPDNDLELIIKDQTAFVRDRNSDLKESILESGQDPKLVKDTVERYSYLSEREMELRQSLEDLNDLSKLDQYLAIDY